MENYKLKSVVKSGTKIVVSEIAKIIATTVATDLIIDGFRLASTIRSSTLTVNEWSLAYNKIQQLIYKLDPNQYIKHKVASTNNEYYELELGTSYFIKRSGLIMKVEQFKESKDESAIFAPCHRLKITFYGKNKYKARMKFLEYSMRYSDKQHIKIQYLGSDDIDNKIITHDFDHLVLSPSTKSHIIDGLIGWRNSIEWYRKHQMVHKIGVFLYGKPGTGKSTIVRSISNMFDNAPIFTLDASNVMKSIKDITEQRKRYDRTIIVLIEDFDMFFKSREELENMEEDINLKKQKDFNQNAIFQMLDGIYSTDDTIYIATTNHIDRLDPALIRPGRFDIQEELKYFDKSMAEEAIKLLDYDISILDNMELQYPIQPSLLQSKILEYRSSTYLN